VHVVPFLSAIRGRKESMALTKLEARINDLYYGYTQQSVTHCPVTKTRTPQSDGEVGEGWGASALLVLNAEGRSVWVLYGQVYGNCDVRIPSSPRRARDALGTVCPPAAPGPGADTSKRRSNGSHRPTLYTAAGH
jgi:hypothetical protein